MNPKLLEQIASMTGGTPYLASDSRALRDRFQKILAELKRAPIHDRGMLYAELYRRVPAGGVRAARRRDRAAPHPFFADALTMRFVSPHALWLLLSVPAAVIAYGVFFGVRRRRLARLGDAALVDADDRRACRWRASWCARR